MSRCNQYLFALASKSAKTICTALCRKTVPGCNLKLLVCRQTARSPSTCEPVCFGKAAIVRPEAPPTGRHTIQSKNTLVARPRALDSRLTSGAVAPTPTHPPQPPNKKRKHGACNYFKHTRRMHTSTFCNTKVVWDTVSQNSPWV